MNCLLFIVLTCLQSATSQLYFGNIGGLNGWFGKASDRYLNRIIAAECSTKTCIPYPTLEELNGREYEGRAHYRKGMEYKDMDGIDHTGHGHTLGESHNFHHKRGHKTTVEWGMKQMMDDSVTEEDESTSTAKPDAKGGWGEWKYVSKETTTDTPTEPSVTTTETPEVIETTTPAVDQKNGSNDTEIKSRHKHHHKTEKTDRRSAPLVQVYVVASGSGGAHTNIGDGGFFGKNNGHAIGEGKDKHGWAGGIWIEPGEKDKKQDKIPHDVLENHQGAFRVSRYQSNHSDRLASSFSLPLDDTLSESSTKYRIGYQDIDIKPEGPISRTRRRMLNNWHKGDLLNGYWRFWFKRR